MNKEKSKPIRMCVVCRKRFLQSELLRYSIQNGEIKEHKKVGRSVYFCSACKTKSMDKLIKILSNKYKIDINSIKSIF